MYLRASGTEDRGSFRGLPILDPRSRRAYLRHPIQRHEERVPDAALAGEGLTASARELVVAPAALPRALHPAALDQAAVFQAIERGVERGDGEADRAGPPAGGQPADLLAVPLPPFRPREEQEPPPAAVELPVEGGRPQLW